MNSIRQSTNEEVIVIYHSNCHDGLVAAFTIWLDLRNKAEYYPSQFGSPPPDVTGKSVYILDFSYPYEILKSMIEKSHALLVVDHHLTALENLTKIPEKHKIFNLTECGATLTWKFLNPDKPVPLLYKYIRARDLWTRDLPGTDEFDLAFDLAIRGNDGQYSFELIEKYLKEKEIQGLIQVGKILLPYQNAIIEKSIGRAFFCPVWIPEGNDDKKLVIAAYINTTQLISDIGARCMEEYPFVDFCVCFYIDSVYQQTQFCLRSNDQREDVSVIAKNFGGGGHRNAASFRLDGLYCRLNYEHLDPVPLNCMLKGTRLKLNHELSSILYGGYLQLLKQRFPGKVLQLDLTLE